MNPTAVVFWLFCACIGFLVSSTVTGVVTGAAIGLGISLLASLLPPRR